MVTQLVTGTLILMISLLMVIILIIRHCLCYVGAVSITNCILYLHNPDMVCTSCILSILLCVSGRARVCIAGVLFRSPTDDVNA
jgi:hypothetical protein